MLTSVRNAPTKLSYQDPSKVKNLLPPSLYTTGPGTLGVQFLMVYPAIQLLSTDE